MPGWCTCSHPCWRACRAAFVAMVASHTAVGVMATITFRTAVA